MSVSYVVSYFCKTFRSVIGINGLVGDGDERAVDFYEFRIEVGITCGLT